LWGVFDVEVPMDVVEGSLGLWWDFGMGKKWLKSDFFRFEGTLLASDVLAHRLN
jgi:hypothetical protein